MAEPIIDTEEKESVLDSIVSKPQEPGAGTVTANDIYTFVPEMSPYEKRIYEENLKKERVPAPGYLPHETMFPSASNQINKGSYSGSEIGSMPIFAAGGLAPFGVFDARQRAIENAALKKAKQIDDFQKIYKAPVTKHSSVQGKIDEGYYTGLRQWVENSKKKYGSKWTDALNQDISFQKWNRSWNTVKDMEDKLVEYAAQLETKDKDKNFVLSPQTKKGLQDFMEGVDGLASNPFDPKGHTVNSKLLKLRAEDNLDVVVNDSVDKLIQDVKTSYPGTSDQGIYDLIVTTKTTGTGPDKINSLADGIMKTHYGDGSYFKKEDVVERLKSVLGTKVERTVSHAGNQFNPSTGDGAGFKYTNDDFSNEPQDVNVNVMQTGGGLKAGKITTSDGITFKKPVKVTIPAGTKMIDFDKGGSLPSGATGVKDVILGKAFIAPTYFNSKDPKDPVNGSVMTPEQLKDPKAKGNVIYVPMVFGEYTEKNLAGQDVKSSVSIPMSEIENSLVKEWNSDGTVKTGIPVDIYKQKADQKNQEINQSGVKKTSLSTIKGKMSDPQWAGYTEQELVDYYKSQGYTVE